MMKMITRQEMIEKFGMVKRRLEPTIGAYRLQNEINRNIWTLA